MSRSLAQRRSKDMPYRRQALRSSRRSPSGQDFPLYPTPLRINHAHWDLKRARRNCRQGGLRRSLDRRNHSFRPDWPRRAIGSVCPVGCAGEVSPAHRSIRRGKLGPRPAGRRHAAPKLCLRAGTRGTDLRLGLTVGLAGRPGRTIDLRLRGRGSVGEGRAAPFVFLVQPRV